MDVNTLRSLVTIVGLVTFIGIMVWAYSSRNRDRFENEGRLPLDD